MSKSKIKTMITVFYIVRGVVNKKYLPHGQTENHLLHGCSENVEKKGYMCTKGHCFLGAASAHAPSHASLHVCEFLAKYNVVTPPQLPYSPDLALADFILLPKIKTTFKGRYFDNIKTIRAAVTTALCKMSVEASKRGGRTGNGRVGGKNI